MSLILTDVKEFCNLSEDNDAFDSQIISHINSGFATLCQLGVGLKTPFVINDDSKLWSDFSDDLILQSLAQTYISIKTKLIFDPPLTVAHIESLKNILAETEWRLDSHITAPPISDGL